MNISPRYHFGSPFVVDKSPDIFNILGEEEIFSTYWGKRKGKGKGKGKGKKS